ncbi:CD276 antigen homolog [Cyprinus carpio]|uniref:CD276 antigen homolog n=1 Tax=Cyprinus carpio TaxID=7962 RepID=A0A9Q9XQR4_CYPCA|nr:CD276 antigen homolog [Cyprinus carpio]
MIISWCFICVFAVLINKVSLDVKVVGFNGGSVLLPCSSAKHDLKPQDINVLWRDKYSETIYDLIKGKDSLDTQDSRYKNRTQTFPDEYERGNFSIKLSNLTHADEGEFNCFITHSSFSDKETVWLFINETVNQSTEEENKVPETQSSWMKTLLICIGLLLTLIIVLSVVYVNCCRRKSSQAPI